MSKDKTTSNKQVGVKGKGKQRANRIAEAEKIAEELERVKIYILKHQSTVSREVEIATNCSYPRVATAYKQLEEEKLFSKQDIYNKQNEYNIAYIKKHYRTKLRTEIAAHLSISPKRVSRVIEDNIGAVNMREAINDHYWKCNTDIAFVKLSRKIGITVDKLHEIAESYNIHRNEPIKKPKPQPYQFRESATEILKRKNY